MLARRFGARAETPQPDAQVPIGAAIDSLRAAMELRDPYTAAHQDRVADLAVAIARRMGCDEATITDVRLAGHVHDLGKLGCPLDILAKPTRLSAAEYTIVQEHSQAGWNALRPLALSHGVQAAVLHHHERLDGSGYPHQLRESQIHLTARIICVADVVEAMSSHRPYRPAPGIPAALDEITTGRARTYDADVVDACLRLFHEDTYSL